MSAGARMSAARDVAEGVRRTWLWTGLGWNDIKHRYSGSLLGSLWITANIGLMVLCLTFVFAGPLGSPRSEYAPYVAIGLVLWHFISTSLNEAPNVFIWAAETVRHLPMPLSVQVFRLVWRNAIVLAHNVAVVPVVLLIFGAVPGPEALLALFGLALLAFNLLTATMLLGLLGARFRDVPQIVTNLLQLLFFVTPIFWFPATLGRGGEWLVAFNPVFAFIDVVRAPLLGAAPAAASWPVVLAATALSAAAASLAFSLLREKVAYWV